MAYTNKTGPDFFDRRDLLIRHGIIFLLSVFFGVIGKHAQSSGEIIRNIISDMIYISIIWNGNIAIINLEDRLLSWDNNLRLKLISNSIIAVLWPTAVHYLYNLYLFPIINGHPCDLTSKENITYLVTSVVITMFINSVFVATAFFRFWKRTLLEKEELKRDSISAEFETLKNQINPHFLFNSLNTLTSLIEENPNMATNFVQKLSSVYRYVLSQKDKEKVSLEEELQFIEAYVYLNKIRFGENLNVTIQTDDISGKKEIATLALQMLLENAIKHNIISSKNPLHILIKAARDKVEVRNNLQRKTHVESNGIGLNNIVHRYSFLSKQPVEIEEETNEFVVKLPLL